METEFFMPRGKAARLPQPVSEGGPASDTSFEQTGFTTVIARVNVSDEDCLRALLEHCSDSIYFKDKNSRFIRCGQAKMDRHAVTSDEIVGKTDADFFDESHARKTAADEAEIIRSGMPAVGQVEQTTTLNGDIRWVLSDKWPLRNRQGDIVGTFGISKDITALKSAEFKFEQTHKKLVDASRVAGMAEVATAVLHNVGNVLNSANISAALLSDQLRNSKTANLGKAAALLDANKDNLAAFLKDDPKGRQLIPYLVTLAAHLAAEEKKFSEELASLCANIEHIKEIISTQQSYASLCGMTETLAPADLVEDALRLNAGSCKRHGIEMVREFQPVPPVSVDKHKVLQILVNLISNAKHALEDAGPPERRLVIRIAPGSAGTVRISIIDNGVGIDAENLTRIFAHGFTTRKGGHGFGLHSSALAAKQMGGSLTCHSAGPGTGAEFILELPLVPAA